MERNGTDSWETQIIAGQVSNKSKLCFLQLLQRPVIWRKQIKKTCPEEQQVGVGMVEQWM